MATEDTTIIRTRKNGTHTRAVRVDATTARALASLAEQFGMRATDVVVVAIRIMNAAAPDPDKMRAERVNNLNVLATMDEARRRTIRRQLCDFTSTTTTGTHYNKE